MYMYVCIGIVIVQKLHLRMYVHVYYVPIKCRNDGHHVVCVSYITFGNPGDERGSYTLPVCSWSLLLPERELS